MKAKNDEFEEWLRHNNIYMSKEQWVNHCLKKTWLS